MDRIYENTAEAAEEMLCYIQNQFTMYMGTNNFDAALSCLAYMQAVEKYIDGMDSVDVKVDTDVKLH